ncbi:MAG: YopX family protein [Minisyncoccia bacterium]
MREIKFRAWDKVRKEFLSGGRVLISIEPGKRPKNNPIYLDILEHPDVYRNRFEVMQFTGLKDSKQTKEFPGGQDIYENDIVKAFKHNEDEFINEIVWRGGSLWFGNWNWIEFQNIFRSIEVIGNVFEDKGLIS